MTDCLFARDLCWVEQGGDSYVPRSTFSRPPTYIASIGPYHLKPQVHMGRHRGHRREDLDNPPVVGRLPIRVNACSNPNLDAGDQLVSGHAETAA